VIILAIDTCDSHGSVALLDGRDVLSTAVHEDGEDYSSWLLPAVDRVLLSAGRKLSSVEIYAAAAGPGSFTGIRVALTTVKAWNEVFGRPIAAVSRLEALAGLAMGHRVPHVPPAFVAASCDAGRGQLYGAIYRRQFEGQAELLQRVGDEAVVNPAELIRWAAEIAGESAVGWSSLDSASLAAEGGWQDRAAKGEVLEQASPVLAPAIGRIALKLAAQNQLTDALSLDANYIRRPDAEVKWNGYSRPVDVPTEIQKRDAKATPGS